MTTPPTSFTWLARIREAKEEIASVKYSVTSRLLAQGHGEGAEASGSNVCPVMPEFKFGEGFMAENDGTEDVKKMAFVPLKT